MALKTPAEYVESLRDGRVTYWDGERIDDITNHPRFAVPIAVAAKDYDYDSPESGSRGDELPHRRGRGPPGVPDPAHRGGPAGARRADARHVDRRRHGRVHGADERQGRGRRGEPAVCRQHRAHVPLRAATTTCAPPR